MRALLSKVRTRSSAVCFDVGAAGVRACQVKARGRRIWAGDALCVRTTPREGELEQPVLPECTRLARLVGQGRFEGRDVALVLSPPEVHFHALRVPDAVLRSDRETLEQALKWEITQETRTDPNELEVRFWPLPAGHREGVNVMTVAAPTQIAAGWVAELAEHDLCLHRIDVAPAALARLATWDWTPGRTDVWGVLDIGCRRTVLTTVVGDTPVYVRSAPTGVAGWTQRIAEAFEISPLEAEEIHRRHGVRMAAPHAQSDAVERAALAAEAEEVPPVLFGLLRESLDSLVRLVHLCFGYALESYADCAIERLYLAGGGANLRGLSDYFEALLDFPVHRLGGSTHPLAGPCESAAALGAALLDLEAR